MSSSLIKSYSVNYSREEKKKEKRIIDSNQAVSDRIKELSELLESVPEEDFADDFTEGLDAAQVDALLTDQDELAEEAARNEAAQKLIDDANEQAAQILEDAKAQAAQIIEDANAQSQSIFDEARENGEKEGYGKGYDEGLAKAAQLEKDLTEKDKQRQAEYEEKIAQLEPKFVDTLTGIYSHVFGTDLSGRNDVVLNLLRDTIRGTDGAKNYLVHVSKEDHEYVSANRDELTSTLTGSATVEIIEDATLKEGSCFVETDGGIFDCSIGTELELLKKELKILSYK